MRPALFSVQVLLKKHEHILELPNAVQYLLDLCFSMAFLTSLFVFLIRLVWFLCKLVRQHPQIETYYLYSADCTGPLRDSRYNYQSCNKTKANHEPDHTAWPRHVNRCASK